MSPEAPAESAPPEVCAVVLTYNRKDMLERCLAALAAQTRRCDRVIVVDNASIDGTAAMLGDRWGHLVDIYSLRKNAGAAGGFNMGMRLAYGLGADFIWTMDDDVIAEPDALEHLLRAYDLLQRHRIDPPYLVSVPRSTTGQLTEIPDIDRRKNVLGFPRWAELLEHGLVPTLGATFASILLPRETLRANGLPIASMFIFGEDREFTVRVSQWTPGFLVGASRVLHARKLEGALSTLNETNTVRLGYHYYLHRNTTSTVLGHDDWRRIGLHFWRQMAMVFRLLMRGRPRRAWIVVAGTAAGVFYRPRPEPADAPFDPSCLRAAPHMAEPRREERVRRPPDMLAAPPA
jgi:dTDP-4-dehydrorhamnose reductase